MWLIGFLGRARPLPGDRGTYSRAEHGAHWHDSGLVRWARLGVRRAYGAPRDTIATGGDSRDIRAFERAAVSLDPPLSILLRRGNEEASSGSLKETSSRVTTRRHADEQPRDTAITPFISFSFGAALHLPRFGYRRAGNYGCVLVIPARYAVKPTRRTVMTAFVCLLGPARLGCDGDAAP